MHFPISGVTVSPFVPVLTGFVIAFVTTPAGVSGAFLLLPFQLSVLGFTSPGVTPTNLLYNVISTPGGITRYRQQGAVDTALVKSIVMGAVPAVIVGSILRVTVFEAPASFKVFVGFVLLAVGLNILVQAAMRKPGAVQTREKFNPVAVTALAAVAGVIGGIYGVSGGSIIAPVLVGVFRIPVRRVASAALVATLITSVAGVISFELLARFGSTADPSARPDWMLALLFGIGGAAGGYLGARFSRNAPELALRILLGTLAVVLAGFYIAPIF